MLVEECRNQCRGILRLLDERNVSLVLNLPIFRSRDVFGNDLREERWDKIVVVAGDYQRRAFDVLKSRCKDRLFILARQTATPPKDRVQERIVKFGGIVAYVSLVG